MPLILPQTNFEAISPKDVMGIAFLAEADALRLLPQAFFSHCSRGSYFESFEILVNRPFQKCMVLKLGPNLQKRAPTQILTAPHPP